MAKNKTGMESINGQVMDYKEATIKLNDYTALFSAERDRRNAYRCVVLVLDAFCILHKANKLVDFANDYLNSIHRVTEQIKVQLLLPPHIE